MHHDTSATEGSDQTTSAQILLPIYQLSIRACGAVVLAQFLRPEPDGHLPDDHG